MTWQAALKKTTVELDLLTESLRNGVLFVLVWVAWVGYLRGWHDSVCGVGGVLAWVAWVACLRSVGDVPAWLMWVVYVYVFMCDLFRFGVI